MHPLRAILHRCQVIIGLLKETKQTGRRDFSPVSQTTVLLPNGSNMC